MPDCAKYNDRPVDTGVSFVPCSKLSEGGRQAGRQAIMFGVRGELVDQLLNEVGGVYVCAHNFQQTIN